MRTALLVAGVVAVVSACGGKTIKGPTYTVEKVRTAPVDKLDLLFAIDNSASMADKQSLLAASIPAFVGRLLNPNCVDITTSAVHPGDGSNCSTIPNTKAEFPAVHDLHIGIVSSSLGGGGSPDVCVESSGDPTHENDQGHLLDRPTVNNAKPVDGNGGNFLAWLPLGDKNNAGKKSADVNVTIYGDAPSLGAPALISDFQSLIIGVDQHGCGLEAQLESWYHFLIQPDPWDAITQSGDNPPKNQLDGVDATLIKMRHDFLRPDSIVAIVQLTDEEDSWSDPMWIDGYGWTNRTQSFPGGPGQGAGPIGTTECFEPIDINNVATTGPNNPDCTSCAFPGSSKPISKTLVGSDANCNACAGGMATCPAKGWYTPAGTSVPIAAADGLNVRYAQQTMRRRYGFDSQFSVQRYVDGLTQKTVPDRDHEDHTGPQNYASATQRNCTNPLFAGALPDGSDTSPNTLCQLAVGARTPDMIFYTLIGGVPAAIATGDWKTIVGADPEHYVFDGIDPRMLESTSPRSGVTGDWNTLTSVAGIDLEYACTFDLPTPRDCAQPQNQGACDCVGAAASAKDGPPLCDSTTPTTQIKGKAYPTIRELRVAQGLGAQGVIGSICDTTGYASTLDKLVGQLAPAMGCVTPTVDPKCTSFILLPTIANQSAACTDVGEAQPSADMLAALASAGISGVACTASLPDCNSPSSSGDYVVMCPN